MRKTLLAVALALASTGVLAQGPGHGPGGGMMGGGMMGGGMMGSRGHSGGMMGLAALNLSDEQVDKIFAIQEQQRRKMYELRRDTRKQIEGVLTPEQRKDLRSRGPWWADE